MGTRENSREVAGKNNRSWTSRPGQVSSNEELATQGVGEDKGLCFLDPCSGLSQGFYGAGI